MARNVNLVDESDWYWDDMRWSAEERMWENGRDWPGGNDDDTQLRTNIATRKAMMSLNLSSRCLESGSAC